MSCSIDEQLSKAQAELDGAARLPVIQVPASLMRAVDLLQEVRLSGPAAPAGDRQIFTEKLEIFRSRLVLFATALQRGETILQYYVRAAGVSCQEYRPGGLPASEREPVFVNFAL